MPEIPGRDEQILQAIINGTEYTQIPQSRIEYLLLQLKAIVEGGSGVSDYTELENKPSINNVILVGNKSLSDLGIVNPMMIKGRVNSVSDLPQVAEPGWVYFVGRSDDADLREYVYTVNGEWEFLGYLSIVIDSALSTTSENPVQNKVITNAMVGEKTTGKQYVIDGQTVTAGDGAEIFNDYANNKATGQYSHAEGVATIAASANQHVQGKYNVEDANDTYAFIIGNGNFNARHNAFAIDWNGNIYVDNSSTGVNLNTVASDVQANAKAIEQNKTDILSVSERVAELEGTSLPDYWEEYLPEKIEQINSLQKQGGKDCFSFVAIADIHYPSNLGKLSPKIAEKIMNETNIKHAVILGDTQTRGCYFAKSEIIDENVKLKEMLSPIAQRMLRTRGNHDLNWGKLDRDGNGIYNNDIDGVVKPPEERETYVYSMTDGEVYEEFFRPVGIVGNANFDESGTGYWIDDISNKVRYIVLNTQNSKYELQADGTQKYPPMWVFRFQQSQFDMAINALSTVPTDEWGVVVCGHCPLWQEIGDREVMIGMLSAYNIKTTYTGTYEGTASGEAAYINHAEPLPDNMTDTTKWVNGYRFSSTGISAQSGTTISNVITCTNGDVIRIKGIILRSGADRFAVNRTAVETGNTTDGYAYYNSPITIGGDNLWNYEGEENGVYRFTIGVSDKFTVHSLRFAMPTPANVEDIIVTVNEEIVNLDHGYDYVSVDADFSDSKGTLIGYFAGHSHIDNANVQFGFPCITTRCDGKEENTEELKAERVKDTVTEQSFDVFTVNKKTRRIYATKIGAGSDREISY